MINTRRVIYSTILFSSLSFSSLVGAQSLSKEIFKNIDGKRFWQVEVDCGSSSSQQLDQNPTTQEWCINDSNNCYADKKQAAKQACTSNSSSSIPSNTETPETPKPAPLSSQDSLEEDDDDDYENEEGNELIIDYDALRLEKQELETQQLEIKQKLLELKRKEIELKKASIAN